MRALLAFVAYVMCGLFLLAMTVFLLVALPFPFNLFWLLAKVCGYRWRKRYPNPNVSNPNWPMSPNWPHKFEPDYLDRTFGKRKH